MANINLLPWREARRARDDKRMLVLSVLFWALCLIAGFLAISNINGNLKNQQARNNFLVQQNAKLNREIKDIEKLQSEKQELVGRIEVIQNLQQDRMQIVHVFDDIVRKLPAGITLDTMSKKDKEIRLKGRAQSNSRVSELMNQLDTSQWFGESDLAVVSLKATRDQQIGDSELRDFEVAVTEKFRELDGELGARP